MCSRSFKWSMGLVVGAIALALSTTGVSAETLLKQAPGTVNLDIAEKLKMPREAVPRSRMVQIDMRRLQPKAKPPALRPKAKPPTLATPEGRLKGARIQYHFSGVGSSKQEIGFFNGASIKDTISGTFSFDDSLFSGVGFFHPPGKTYLSFIHQESPDAFITFDQVISGQSRTISTEPVIRKTARPDLRFVDSDTSRVGFIYDNFGGPLGGVLNLNFDIPHVDDRLDLIGATGRALYRTKYQIGTNVGYLFDITVDRVVHSTVPKRR